MRKKQKDFIEIYLKKGLNISLTCSACNIDRSTYYDWMDKYPEFKQAVEEAVESLHDRMESRIIQACDTGDTKMLIHWSKTKMKDRGYVERTETIMSGGLDLTSAREAYLKATSEEGKDEEN